MNQEIQELESVPQGVQEQAKKADELIKQAANPNTQQGSEAVEQEAEPSDTQYSGQNAEQQEQGAGQDESSKSKEAKETWQNKYQVLKGKYDAEVPRLSQENKDLKQQVQDLSAQVQNLQQKVEQSSKQPEEEPVNLNPDDFAEYGEEFQQLVKRLNSLESENQDLKSQLSSVNQTVGSVQEHQQQSATERFWQDLNSVVPNWEQINQDQDFLNWLGEFDPVGGQTRNDALQEAHSNLDARRVAAIFNSFIESEAGSKYRQGSKQEPKQQQKQERPKNVQPPRSTAETPPTQQQGQNVWTPEGIKDFYDKVRRGVYKGREEEMNKLERDIFQAQHEGRIQT